MSEEVHKNNTISGITIESYETLSNRLKDKDDSPEALEDSFLKLQELESESDKGKVVETLNTIAGTLLYQGKTIESRKYYTLAIESLGNSVWKNDERALAMLYHNLGTAFFLEKNISQAQEFYEKAYKIRKKSSKEDTLEIASSLFALSMIQKEKKQSQLAVTLALQALRIREKLLKETPTAELAENYNFLANLYYQLDSHDVSFEYDIKYVECCEKMYGKYEQSLDLLYRNLAEIYYYKRRYHKTLEYLKKSMRITTHSDSKNYSGIVLCQRMSRFFEDWNSLEHAEAYLKKAQTINKKIGLKASSPFLKEIMQKKTLLYDVNRNIDAV